LRLFLITCLAAFTREPFEFGSHRVAPGESRPIRIPVGETEIPITIIHGKNPGPVLTLTAGIHGDEFPSILALQRLRNEVAAESLNGTLVLVHVANLPGFLARRIALSPVDGKNLNRVFPGKPDGTLTEQVAHFLTTEVIARTGYLIDMHSGSANQELWPHVYSPVTGDAELDRRSLEFAKGTGMRHIVLYGDRPRDPANSISYPNTAATRGKPALTTEIGHLGQRTEEQVGEALTVARNALRHLKMVPGVEPPAEGFTLYRKLHEVGAPVSGIFRARCRAGELVDRGALLGEISDYFGNKAAELRSPVRGIVMMLQHTPPVSKGESPVTIGEWQ
jgi:predicted deacylase